MSEGPNPEYELFTLDLSVLHEIKPWLVYQGALHGQYTSDILFNTGQLFLGDYFSVRGYRDSNVVGDYGAYLRNDFTLKQAPAAPDAGLLRKLRGRFSPFGFVDVGFADAEYLEDSIWIGSGGIGIAAEFGKYIKAQGYAAYPVWHSGHVEVEDEPQYYFSVTLKPF